MYLNKIQRRIIEGRESNKSWRQLAREIGITQGGVRYLFKEIIAFMEQYAIEEKPDRWGYKDLLRHLRVSSKNITYFHIINAIDTSMSEIEARIIKYQYGLYGGSPLSDKEILSMEKLDFVEGVQASTILTMLKQDALKVLKKKLKNY
jgi:hypothetical protein